MAFLVVWAFSPAIEPSAENSQFTYRSLSTGLADSNVSEKVLDMAKPGKQVHRRCGRPEAEIRHVHLENEALHVWSIFQKPRCGKRTDTNISIWREDSVEGVIGEE